MFQMEFDTLPTKFTDKAQDLIDYALSFVPDRKRSFVLYYFDRFNNRLQALAQDGLATRSAWLQDGSSQR